MAEPKIDWAAVQLDTTEVVERAKLIAQKLERLEFTGRSTGLIPDEILTAVAAYYAALALVAPRVPLWFMIQVVGRFYGVMEGLATDQILERLRQEVIMVGDAGQGRVM